MKQPIIEVKDISKKYILSHRPPYETLRDIVTEFAKKPFRNLRRGAKETKEDFWALKDVSFNVQQGEAIGLIGANGSGKSTLLKILSQITDPTEGEIKIRGRVASLLEVGTGFHPELTGRENIFLNGAILGMKNKEINEKFDDIVKFSGVEKFLDTPIKRYSSGMYVRLAFAVAAHMDPDILIVDEVLAVGDAEFQKKCIEKMENITKTGGRTVIFVSHNLIAIQNLCTKTIALEHGQIKHMGDTKEVIDQYMADKTRPSINPELSERGDVGEIRFTDIQVTNTNDSTKIKSGDALRFKVSYSSDFAKPIAKAQVIVSVLSSTSKVLVARLDSTVTADTFTAPLTTTGDVICETGPMNFVEGLYTVNLDFLIDGENRDHMERTTSFNIETDNKKYNFRADPDANATDYVVDFKFSQVE